MERTWLVDKAIVQVDERCDLCSELAVWFIRRRFAGEGWQRYHACAKHVVRIRAKVRKPRPSGEYPIEVETSSNFAF